MREYLRLDLDERVNRLVSHKYADHGIGRGRNRQRNAFRVIVGMESDNIIRIFLQLREPIDDKLVCFPRGQPDSEQLFAQERRRIASRDAPALAALKLMGAAVEKTAEDFPEVFEKRGTDFFYAKIYLSGITVNYDFETGYDCTAVINLIMPITDDVEFALIEPYLPDDPQKDPGLSEAYRAIIGNLDTIYKDSTHGITLLDLDFDGTPEVLVSDIFKRDRQYVGDRVGVDVSIYRIENGDLKYIDTFPNAHWVIEEIWNSLGLKTLPDGTKAWFSTSYDDGDFLYRLEGD